MPEQEKPTSNGGREVYEYHAFESANYCLMDNPYDYNKSNIAFPR